MPAMLKGYFDRVFSYGFAFEFSDKGPKGLLKGKKAVIINTLGSTTREWFLSEGYHDAIKKITEGKIRFLFDTVIFKTQAAF